MSFGGGSVAPNTKPKPLGVDEHKLSTNEQARPVPFFAGKVRTAVSFISDVFQVRRANVTQTVGKQTAKTGVSYFASFAALIGYGPVDILYEVRLNGEKVWPDANAATLPNQLVRDVSNPDFVDLTIPDYGLIRFYWGTETQVADFYLRRWSRIEHPPYHGMCYLVAHQLFLGFNQTNVQNFEVVVGRFPVLGSSPKAIGDDANPANILYDLLTHPRLGRALPYGVLDTAAFESLGGELAGEKIGISPLVNTQREAAQLIQDILEYFDGYPVIDTAGVLSFGRVRPSDAVVAQIDETLMSEPINISPKDWSSTFNETNVKFSDPTHNFEPDARTWRDRGNFQVTGQLNTQTIERLWVTNPNVASFLAAALGRTASLPEATGSLKLRYTSLFDNLHPGSVFLLNYPPRGYVDLRCRITDVILADPGKPEYEIHFMIDRSYLLAGLVVAAAGAGGGEEPVPVAQIETLRIVELPVGLCPDGKLALCALCAREDPLTGGFVVHLGAGYDATGLIAPESFEPVQAGDRFAFHGELLEDYPANTQPIDLSIGIPVRLSGVDLELPEATQFTALADELLAFIDGEVLAVVHASLVGIAEYRLSVARGRFGSPVQAHAVGADVFVIAKADLVAIQHASLQPKNTAILKIQATTGQALADLQDTPETTLAISGRIYSEPPPAVSLNGKTTASVVTTAGTDLAVVLTPGDAGLPWRSDLLRRTFQMDFYDAAGAVLLGSTASAEASFTIGSATLAGLTGGAASFQFRARQRTVSDWWEIDTQPTTVNVTRV